MTGMRRVRTGWRQLVFTSVSRVKPSRKIPVKHSVLLNCHIWYTLSLPTLYIPPLPTDVEECFERKPYPQHLRVRDCYTYISLYNPLWFFLNSYISISISFKRLIAQTLTTPILSVKWGFGATGKHWKKPSFGGCNQAYCGIQRARQDTVPKSFVGVGAWRA